MTQTRPEFLRPVQAAAVNELLNTIACCASKRNWVKSLNMGSVLFSSADSVVKRRLSKVERRNRRFWIAIAIMLIVAFMFMYGGNGLYDSLEMKRQVNVLKKRNDSLLLVNKARRLKLDKLSAGDPFTLEKEARKSNMIFPSEKVFIIRPEKNKGRTLTK